MDEHNRPLESPGYETKDINGRGLRLFAVALIGLCVVALLGLAGLFRLFKAREDTLQPGPESIGANSRGAPPEPRLEETPSDDLKRFRESEDQILGSYGWVDKERGVIRTPVSRAMELLVERGLPARAAALASGGAAVPTESSTRPGGAQ